jgi:hypothetical protein
MRPLSFDEELVFFASLQALWNTVISMLSRHNSVQYLSLFNLRTKRRGMLMSVILHMIINVTVVFDAIWSHTHEMKY